MTERWESDFDFYEAQFDEARVAIFLDLAASAHAPVATHPLRLQVRVAMKSPRPDGLRAPEEEEALFAVEDAIVLRVTSALDALFVGRVIAEGYATFAFYAPIASASRAENASAIIGSLAPYALEWNVSDDEAWAYYRELLYPDPESYKLMMSRRAADRITGVGRQ